MRLFHGDEGYDEDHDSIDIFGRRIFKCPEQVITDKSVTIRTNLHYSDPDAKKTLTVFGKAEKNLFYNYDDRLYGEKWLEGQKIALQNGLTPGTVKYYEAILNHFHDTDKVDIRHVLLGCNVANGFSYLVFGYFGV